MSQISGKTAFITGAASGIGRATSLAMAQEGATALILLDINSEGLKKTASEIERMGTKVRTVLADVTDFAQVKKAVDEAIDFAGKIDFLLNIAGVASMAPIENFEISDWERIIKVDLWGPINTVNALYPHMVEKKSGHVVNVASISGLWADQIYIAPYLTAKFGVVGLCEGLKAESFLHGIKVTCVCPGMVQTPIWEASPLKGFREDVRKLVKYFALLGEKPENTAQTIIKAIKKDKYIQVTTPFQRVHYALRRHFPRLFNTGARVFFRFMAYALEKYREK